MTGIVSDSTCDLSAELVSRYGIHILPLHVIMGDDERLDGVNVTPDELFRWSDEHRTTPGTSAPSIADTAALFRELLDKYDEIVSFSISSQFSASGNVMRLAAEELEAEDRIHIVDSRNLSTGIGLLVIAAAEMASAGNTSEEILARMDELIPRVRASFVIEQLEYLRRGGRCGGLTAMVGSVFRLHPKIVVQDGAMSPSGTIRGSLGRVCMTYAKGMEEQLLKAVPDRVFITYSSKDEPAAAGVHEYLESLGVFREILETRAGSVISSHCGPGTLGVLFIAGEE